jgi:PTS system N-acetylglucosamine-specific IIC component
VKAVPATAEAADAGGGPAPVAKAVGFVRALGGNRNLKLVDACTTRLRLEVVDDSLVNEPALRSLGAHAALFVPVVMFCRL